jgi:hypothetical protein
MNNNESAQSKERNFIQHLKNATKTVQSWPEWKRHLLGAATPEERQNRMKQLDEKRHSN